MKKLPIVWEYFKFPEDGEILEIDTTDILDNLRSFLTEKDLWQSRDLKKELEPFMMYLVERVQGVANPYYLGVRISSVLLAVQGTSTHKGETFFICWITLHQLNFFRLAIEKKKRKKLYGEINHYIPYFS